MPDTNSTQKQAHQNDRSHGPPLSKRRLTASRQTLPNSFKEPVGGSFALDRQPERCSGLNFGFQRGCARRASVEMVQDFEVGFHEQLVADVGIQQSMNGL